jgi:hypothetical protein
MEGRQILSTEALVRLFDEQIKFSRRRTQQQPSPAELREWQERQERMRQLFVELRRQKHDRDTRFVRMMGLCEAKGSYF